MIYEVSISELPKLTFDLDNKCRVISISKDSSKALISRELPPDVFIAQHDESTLNTILGLDEWRQPCKSCGVV